MSGGDERDSDVDISTLQTDRAVEIVIEARVAYVAGGVEIDVALDNLCREVELAWYSDHTLGGLLLFSEYLGTDLEFTEGEEVQPEGGRASIRYRCVYAETWQ